MSPVSSGQAMEWSAECDRLVEADVDKGYVASVSSNASRKADLDICVGIGDARWTEGPVSVARA